MSTFPPNGDDLRNDFIVHNKDTDFILQRVHDGYINATALCKACGKQANDYLRLSTTRAFFSALEAETGIPVSELVQVRRGGEPLEQGTWVHPKVAINLAQWASPDFAVQVVNWVFEWMEGKLIPRQAKDPLELIIETAKIALDIKRDQLQLGTRQEALEQRQDALEAKVESTVGDSGWYTVKAYAKVNRLSLPRAIAKEAGLQAKKLSEEKGEYVGQARDETFGLVNVYHESILYEVFKTMNLFKLN